MKVRILAVCVVSMAMLIATHPALSAPTQESACASVTIYATNSAVAVAPGNTIGLTGKFTNCSSGRLRFNYTLSAMSSCGQRVDIATARKTLDPGSARIWSVSYTMPASTCSGPWEATMKLSSGDATLASAATIVTVE